jgi:hypothetical protein
MWRFNKGVYRCPLFCGWQYSMGQTGLIERDRARGKEAEKRAIESVALNQRELAIAAG